MRLKKLVMLLLPLSIGQACTSVQIKDAEACSDFGVNGAHCDWLFHSEPRDLPFEDWDKERFGMICTKASNFVDWQADIQKLCSISHRCTREDQAMLENFFLRISEIASPK
jgi:hypothetical protein